MKRLFLISLLCIFVFCYGVSANEIKNPGDTLLVSFDVPPSVTLDSIPDLYILNTAGDTLSSSEFSVFDVSDSTVFTASYVIPSSTSLGAYQTLVEWSYSGEIYRKIGHYDVNQLYVTVQDSLEGRGYISHVEAGGGAFTIPGGAPAVGATIIILNDGTSNAVAMDETDAAGEFKIWVNSGVLYDVIVRLPGYSDFKYYDIAPITS